MCLCMLSRLHNLRKLRNDACCIALGTYDGQGGRGGALHGGRSFPRSGARFTVKSQVAPKAVACRLLVIWALQG